MDELDKGNQVDTPKDVTPEGDLNIADMSNDEITQAVTDGKLSIEDVKTYSEKLEADTKTLDDKSQTVLNDRLAKIDKLRTKAKEDVTPEPKAPEQTTTEVDVDDIITLREQKFSKDSDEAKILKQFKDAGLITDYQSGLEDVAVKAKLEAIKVTKDAEHEIDRNSDEDAKLQTKNTIYDNHKATGKEPETDYEKQVIVDKMLDTLEVA